MRATNGDNARLYLRIYRPRDQGQDRIRMLRSLSRPPRPPPPTIPREGKGRRGAGGRTAPPGITLVSFVRASLNVLGKDLRIELATREIVTTAAFFAALVAIMASVSFTTGPEATTRVAPGALWLSIAFASVLALGRSWQREREESALVGLLVSPVPRAAIWCGKAVGVLGFLLAVEVVVVPLVALLFHVDLPRVMGPLALVLLVGTVGVAATGTLFGAMTVRTGARELLLATVLFPLLSPALVSSVGATREIFYAAASGQRVDVGEVRDWLVLLGVFDLVAVVGAVAMFGALVED
ncbi:MAG: heme exporter protein CcmB [Myxococcota bacterium]|nr:heme exporter protein CcmB [Myxococcota bacterium]